jgi:hypothetical protein
MATYFVKPAGRQKVPAVELVLYKVSHASRRPIVNTESYLQLVVTCAESFLAYLQKLVVVDVSVLDDLRGRLRQCRRWKYGGWQHIGCRDRSRCLKDGHISLEVLESWVAKLGERALDGTTSDLPVGCGSHHCSQSREGCRRALLEGCAKGALQEAYRVH